MYVSSAYLQSVFPGAEVGGSDDVGRRSDGRFQDDDGRDLQQRRRLTVVHGAVRVAAEVLDQPVVYVVRDVVQSIYGKNPLNHQKLLQKVFQLILHVRL